MSVLKVLDLEGDEDGVGTPRRVIGNHGRRTRIGRPHKADIFNLPLSGLCCEIVRHLITCGRLTTELRSSLRPRVSIKDRDLAMYC